MLSNFRQSLQKGISSNETFKFNPNRPFNRKLLTANTSPMEVTASFEADLKIHGLVISFVFSVVEKLTYDCILGMNFLQDTNAIIDASSGTLSVYHGLLTCTNDTSNDNPATVQLMICNVTIPPLSETALPIKATWPSLKGTLRGQRTKLVLPTIPFQ
jgi:hypothetical protein